MTDTQLYKQQLLDHFKNPRNKASGDMSDKAFVERGSNPRCGDDIEVGFNVQSDAITDLEFRGRGCSVCLASTSMMTEVLAEADINDAKVLSEKMRSWVAGNDEQMPENLQPLEAVKHHPARKKCVMLCWNALDKALENNYV